VLKFFSLTFAAAWICFMIAGELSSKHPSLAGLRWSLLLLGTFAPSLVALTLTARTEGRAGMVALLRRIFEWRVKVRWYVFAVGYMAAIKVAVALVHRVVTGTWPRLGQEAWYIVVAAIAISTWTQAGEEVGWRGYALPRLGARLGFGRASVLLGAIWACWHLPLFFIPGIDKFGQSFPVYLLQVTALSVAAAWLYLHTNGSLLLVMLMHSAVNQTIGIVPSSVAVVTTPFTLTASLVAWLTVAFLWIAAGYFLIRMPKTAVGTLGDS
jgi:membrane protease YdiL (CAAX protease family)